MEQWNDQLQESWEPAEQDLNQTPTTTELAEIPVVEAWPVVDDTERLRAERYARRIARQKQRKREKILKIVAAAIAVAVVILIVSLCFGSGTASSYEEAVEMVCEALEDGDADQILELLFDRNISEERLEELFEDLEYYYGEDYTVRCSGITLVDQADASDFSLLDRACKIMISSNLEEELDYMTLGELSDLSDALDNCSSDEQRHAYMAKRYGGTYPVDISRFRDCEAYYVKAQVKLADEDGRNADTSTVYFTIICRDGDYMIDAAEGAGIVTAYLGDGHLNAACDDALIYYNEMFFELDELLD